MRNDTIRLTNDLNRENLKNLGFTFKNETKEFECLCQDKYFKYATKKVWVVITDDFNKKYIRSLKKEYDESEAVVDNQESIIHVNIHTTSELTFLLRTLV